VCIYTYTAEGPESSAVDKVKGEKGRVVRGGGCTDLNEMHSSAANLKEEGKTMKRKEREGGRREREREREMEYSSCILSRWGKCGLHGDERRRRHGCFTVLRMYSVGVRRLCLLYIRLCLV
jgi:hypothetical protein